MSKLGSMKRKTMSEVHSLVQRVQSGVGGGSSTLTRTLLGTLVTVGKRFVSGSTFISGCCGACAGGDMEEYTSSKLAAYVLRRAEKPIPIASTDVMKTKA